MTAKEEIATKEKISKILERLPAHFKRTHRSFIVNTREIKTYTNEYISLEKTQIPISRTYKADVMEYLENE